MVGEGREGEGGWVEFKPLIGLIPELGFQGSRFRFIVFLQVLFLYSGN